MAIEVGFISNLGNAILVRICHSYLSEDSQNAGFRLKSQPGVGPSNKARTIGRSMIRIRNT